MLLRIFSACLGLCLMSTSWANPVIADTAPPQKSETQQAIEQARNAQQPVEILAERTNHATVHAHPDGRTTMEYSFRPLRTKRSGEWKEIDTTLQVTNSGIRPRAADVEMSFSGGGDGPMAVLRNKDKQFDIGSPIKLPKPEIKEDSATYTDVLPGIDMRITADVYGYSNTFIVKTPEAGAHPFLADISYPLAADGLSVTADENGNIAAKDEHGDIVFGAPPPKMWDSSGDTPAADPQAAFQAGAAVATMTTRISSNELAVIPDPEFLKNGTYPIYIDPSFSGGRINWTYTSSAYPNESYWNLANGRAQVGYATDYSPTRYSSVDRSFFQMDTSGIVGKQIIGATFRTKLSYSWSCQARDVQLWHTGVITPSSTWNNPPNLIKLLNTQNVAGGYSSSCPAREVPFDVTEMVRSISSCCSHLTFGLVAGNESDVLAWKKFDTGPTLQIEFNTLPDTPTAISTDPDIGCVDGDAPNTTIPTVWTRTPALRARLTDADPGTSTMYGRFEWYLKRGINDRVKRGDGLSGLQPSGADHLFTIPTDTFTSGDVVSWRVQADDSHWYSSWSKWCDVRIDADPPPAPIVSSVEFPENGPGLPVGETGWFAVSDNGSSDTVGYHYGINQNPPSSYQAADATGDATIEFTAQTDGPHTLFVQATDAASNRSPLMQYLFTVQPPENPDSLWRLDEGQGTTATDSHGIYPMEIYGNALWDNGRVEGALAFPDGTGAAYTDRALLGVESFTIAGWVGPDAIVAGQGQTIWAQLNNYYSGAARADRYALRINESGRYIFEVGADKTNPTTVIGPQATVGAWNHVTVTYDLATGQTRLFIDGQLAAETTDINAANRDAVLETLSFEVGESFITSDPPHWGDNLTGAVDELQLFRYAASPVHVATLSQQSHQRPGDISRPSVPVSASERSITTPQPQP